MSIRDLRRQLKVLKLVETFDRGLMEKELNPVGSGAPYAISLLSTASDYAWKELARRAGVGVPSPESRALVVDRYRERHALWLGGRCA